MSVRFFRSSGANSLPAFIFVVTLIAFAWAYGVVAGRYDLFPYPLANELWRTARDGLNLVEQKLGWKRPWYYRDANGVFDGVVRHDTAAMATGLTLVTGISDKQEIMAKVVDTNGATVHSWKIDWFKIWPNPSHLDKFTKPKSKPGAHLHGVILADNGDLIFNFERLGMVRLDLCGNVKWRLARRTHHSLHWDPESKTIWTSAVIPYRGSKPPFPNHAAPYSDFTVMEVSPDGRVLEEISLTELLIANGLQGLLYQSNIENRKTIVSGDTLHVNDVEPFPASLHPGKFKRGDIMISMRNINAIIVFNKKSREIKFLSIGKVVRQHDPDFVDGNTISVFDNNNLLPQVNNNNSRIVRIDAITNKLQVVYQGGKDQYFFSEIMGKHQILPNNNLLITESVSGRAFEVSESGRLLWEYFNLVAPEQVGLLDEAQRLPQRFDRNFFKRNTTRCN